MAHEHADDRPHLDALALDEGGLADELASQYALQPPQQPALRPLDIGPDAVAPVAHLVILEIEEHGAGQRNVFVLQRAKNGPAVANERQRRIRGAEIQSAIFNRH